MDSILLILFSVSRYALPLTALWILARCARSMLREHYEPETWGYLGRAGEKSAPLRHWENLIGSSRASDITLEDPDAAKNQCALIRQENGDWTLYDLDAGEATLYNGFSVPPEGVLLRDGDAFTAGSSSLRFIDLTEEERAILSSRRTQPGRFIRPGANFALLTVFDLLLTFQLCMTMDRKYLGQIAMGFGCLCVIQWAYYLIMRSIHRTGFEVETMAFFLSGIGFAVAASSVPNDMLKQVLLLLAGVLAFVALGWWLRDLERTKKLRWPFAAAALLLLGVNFVLSKVTYGARNWIQIGGFTIQPSEFVKVAYIYAGAATLDRLFMGRNLFLYILA